MKVVLKTLESPVVTAAGQREKDRPLRREQSRMTRAGT